MHKSLPSDEPKLVRSPIYSHAINYDHKGCLSFSDKLGLLAKNIEDGDVNEGAQLVLSSLPQWALDLTDMSAIDYVMMINRFFNRY